MAIYSIKELEELTGVKRHTIRIWEKRYGLIHPSRTDTNIRYYSDADLKKLLNIALLNRNGFRISQIAMMDSHELAEQVSTITSIDLPGEEYVDVLTLSLIELDTFTFSHIMHANIRQLGFEKVMMEIIYPFIEKLGLLWFSGAMTQAHDKFLNNILRQIILSEIDKLPISNTGEKVILFLPQDNLQELSLLFSQYLMIKRGLQIINLGVGCEVEDVVMAAKTASAQFVFTVNVDEQHDGFSAFVESLATELDELLIVSGGALDLSHLTYHDNLIVLEGMDDTLNYMSKLTRKLASI